MRSRARNSLSGRKAKAAGNALELFLDTQHELALRLGILARIDKIDPPAVVRNGVVCFGERTGADYIAMLGDASLVEKGCLPAYPALSYAAIEAKSTADERFYKSEVKPEQQKHLTAVAQAGGLALLVLEFRGAPVYQTTRGGAIFSSTFEVLRRYACPWLKVPWAKLKTAESVDDIGLVRGGWGVERVYLEKFHPRGTPVTMAAKGRVYPRE